MYLFYLFVGYPSAEEVVVPWNARYSFPSQANKAMKMTPRIPPKNGAVFTPGQIIRLEFPAQGYVNPLNTTLQFDATLFGFTDVTSTGASAALSSTVRFQNNIQSLFTRVRLLYGATPLEDIINYNVIVRCLTNWTATNQQGTMDQTSISEGIGGVMWASSGDSSGLIQGNVNVRQKFIQGKSAAYAAPPVSVSAGSGLGSVPQTGDLPAGAVAPTGTTGTTRRYQINFALGLMTQDKLIPTKFMASQLAIEITLAQPQECIYVPVQGDSAVGSPTYAIANVNLIPEILEFDASYDEMFLRGLREGGVPIKFSSWHTFTGTSGSAASINLLVQERSRSVKALFAVQRRSQPTYGTDSHSTFFDTSSNGQSSLQNFQFRIGGRYLFFYLDIFQHLLFNVPLLLVRLFQMVELKHL